MNPDLSSKQWDQVSIVMVIGKSPYTVVQSWLSAPHAVPHTHVEPWHLERRNLPQMNVRGEGDWFGCDYDSNSIVTKSTFTTMCVCVGGDEKPT